MRVQSTTRDVITTYCYTSGGLYRNVATVGIQPHLSSLQTVQIALNVFFRRHRLSAHCSDTFVKWAFFSLVVKSEMGVMTFLWAGLHFRGGGFRLDLCSVLNG